MGQAHFDQSNIEDSLCKSDQAEVEAVGIIQIGIAYLICWF